MNVPNHENSLENCVHKMDKQSGFVDKFDFIEYKIVKIQRAIMQIRYADCSDLFKNSNLLNVKNHENSIENCELMY